MVKRICTAQCSIYVWKCTCRIKLGIDDTEGNAAELAFDVVVNENDPETLSSTKRGNEGAYFIWKEFL